jgi:intracellular septation protein
LPAGEATLAEPTEAVCLALIAKEHAMTADAETLSNRSFTGSDPSAELEGSPVHPLVHAGKSIAADLLSTLSFVALFSVTHSVYVATGVGIAVGVAQIAWLRVRHRPVDAIQWMSLGLVLVFGGASLLTSDMRFVMLKPTVIYTVVGAVMLKRDWMIRYMPPVALRWSRDVVMVFSRVWAAMMFATAGLNLALAVHGDIRIWAWFIGVFPIASKLTLFVVQYVATRVVVRARKRADAVRRAR